MRKKYKSQRGFTLVEMLACVIVLLLVGLLCSTGLNLALDSYQRSVYESNSQMLESTLDTYLGDILRHARSVSSSTDGEGNEIISFTNGTYQIYEGYICVLSEEQKNGGVFLIYKDAEAEPTLMVSSNVYGGDLYIKDFILSYDEATQMFTGAYVIKSTLLTNVERECEFAYRAVSN